MQKLHRYSFEEITQNPRNLQIPDFSKPIFKHYENLFLKMGIQIGPEYYFSNKYTTYLITGYRIKTGAKVFSIIRNDSKANKSYSWRILDKSSRLTPEESKLLKKFLDNLKYGPLKQSEYKSLNSLIKNLAMLQEDLYKLSKEEFIESFRNSFDDYIKTID